MFSEAKGRGNYFSIIAVALLSLFSFFWALFPEGTSALLIESTLLILVFHFMLHANSYSVTYRTLYGSFFCIYYALAQLVFGLAFNSSFLDQRASIARVALMIIGALFFSFGVWYRNGVRILLISAGAHVIFTLWSLIMPEAFERVVQTLLSDSIVRSFRYFASIGVYSGIATQVGTNSLYITVSLAISASHLIANNEHTIRGLKYFYLASLVLSLLALTVTGKRGPLIANIIALLLVIAIWFYYKGKAFTKKTVKYLLMLSILFIVYVLIFPASTAALRRFINHPTNDITSGRIKLYGLAISMFSQKPLAGWGTGAFYLMHGIDTHNMYLQVLCENGILGFVPLLAFFIINIKISLVALRLNVNKDHFIDKPYLVLSLYYQLFYLIYGLSGNPFVDGFVLIIYLMLSSIPYIVLGNVTENYRKRLLLDALKI